MSNTKNYHAHGGNELVIGGKLTFLPGAVVEGAEGLFDLPVAGEPVLPFIIASDATTVAQLRDSLNQLIAAMKDAGVMAAEPSESPGKESEP